MLKFQIQLMQHPAAQIEQILIAQL